MQDPTCTNTRIRSTADAHKIFTAIQQGLLHMVTRRLDADERQALRSGCIYAWEERGPHTETTGLGIERFTEGRRWSPSRVRDEFLFYYEKYLPPPDLNNPSGKSLEAKPPRDWDPLVKQTYSVWVDTDKGRRKWHLTAYFSQATIDQLSTIDDIPSIRNVVVPDRMFRSTRVAKTRVRAEESKNPDVSKAATSRSYAPFPSPPQYPNKDSTTMTPIFMHEPYRASHATSPHTSTSDIISTSPISPHDGLEYPANHIPYSNHAATPPFSSNYHRSSISLPNSFNQPKTGDIRDGRPQESPYFPSSASSSWTNENGLGYSNSPPQRLAELGSPSSSLSSPLPSPFTLADQADRAYTYPYSPQTTQSDNSHLYSTYSISSALGPLPPLVLPGPESRGGHPSRLPIQESSHGTSYYQSQTSSITNSTNENYSLAPLTNTKRNWHRRERADEDTLRRLHTPRPNP